MVWGIFYWHNLSPLVPIEHRLNITIYLSIVADHVHPFMTTVYPSSDGYFQQVNAPCHKAQIISDWFLEHDNEFTLLKWPPQSPDLNPIEHLWDVVEQEIHIMDVQPTNQQQLCDAIMSIWTKISEECFQHLVESMPRSIKAVLKAKGGPQTRYIYIYIYIYIYMYVCVCVCVCVYIYIYIYIYVCVCVCVYIYVCVCVYVFIYIYIYMVGGWHSNYFPGCLLWTLTSFPYAFMRYSS